MIINFRKWIFNLAEILRIFEKKKRYSVWFSNLQILDEESGYIIVDQIWLH